MATINGTWKQVSTIAKSGGTALELTEDYVLNDGRTMATMTSRFESSGGKLFNKEAGTVVFKSDFAANLGETPSVFEFEKYGQTRKTIELIAAKIEGGTK